VGCAAHPWRAAEAWDRGRAVDGCQVHGQASAGSGQTWKTFLRNHAGGLGADFLVIPTINFRLLSCWSSCGTNGGA
jgi:hypothetical protein